MKEPVPTVAQVAQKLKQWLIEEKGEWQFNKKADPTVFLNLELISGSRSVNAILESERDSVLLMTKLMLENEQIMAYSLQPQLEKRKFSANLLILLYQMGIAAGLPRDPGEKIETISLQRVIFFDGLSKDKFFDTLFTMIMGIEVIRESFRTLPPVSNDSESLK